MIPLSCLLISFNNVFTATPRSIIAPIRIDYGSSSVSIRLIAIPTGATIIRIWMNTGYMHIYSLLTSI